MSEKSCVASTAVGAIIFFAAASACAESESSIYVGIGVGRTEASLPGKLTYYPVDRLTNHDVGFRLILGDEISKYFCVEYDYEKLGEYNMYSGSRSLAERVSAHSLSLLLKHPAGSWGETFFKAGIYRADVDYISSDPTASGSVVAISAKWKLGVGANIYLVDHLIGRIEWGFYKGIGGGLTGLGQQETNDVTNLSASVLWHF